MEIDGKELVSTFDGKKVDLEEASTIRPEILFFLGVTGLLAWYVIIEYLYKWVF